MDQIIQMIEAINSNINSIVWGPVTLIVLLGVGFYFSVRTGFMQIFKLVPIIKETIFKTLGKDQKKKEKGSITPFQALSTALAGTIGTGNIAGVATAITIAGPGAIFWMWVSAFFGMMTKFAEIVLALHYRRRNSKGEWSGGPMIFIEEGLNLRWLACIYAFLGIAASFGVGNMAQVNSISTAMKTAFNIPPIYTGVMISLFVGITVMGGVKAIASITEKLVPFMSVFYILAALIVIAFHFNNIPYAFNVIFTGAFKPLSPVGGFVGATVATAVQKGISRGIFTNEAGLGSASIAHAAADTDHPARQGLWGIFEVFFDTIVMCSITAIAILASGVWTNGQTGTDLTVTAFDTVLNGLGKYFIAISIAVFAFMTLLAWSFYGKKCMEYLAGEEYNKYYITLYLLAIIAGSVLELHLVWEISDVLNGLMAIPNMIGLIFLSKVVIQLAKEGKKKMNL